MRLFAGIDRRRRSAREVKLATELAEARAELAETQARLAVASVEIELLSEVVSRDRQRVKAEAATFCKREVEERGTQHV